MCIGRVEQMGWGTIVRPGHAAGAGGLCVGLYSRPDRTLRPRCRVRARYLRCIGTGRRWDSIVRSLELRRRRTGDSPSGVCPGIYPPSGMIVGSRRLAPVQPDSSPDENRNMCGVLYMYQVYSYTRLGYAYMRRIYKDIRFIIYVSGIVVYHIGLLMYMFIKVIEITSAQSRGRTTPSRYGSKCDLFIVQIASATLIVQWGD